jgi:two-component system sensor histidine kinase/response regulator
MLDFRPRRADGNVANQLGERRARGLALVFDIAPGLAHQLRGDPLRLEQVLLNFTSNAIKFSENGRISCARVAVRTRDRHPGALRGAGPAASA